MKKVIAFALVLITVSCSTTIKTTYKPLYEVLTKQNDGGASIQFYEILTEEREIKMLQNDEKLKKKIKPEDIKTSNFVILNMGEKTSGGYSVGIKNATETGDKIIITVEEKAPASGEMTASIISYPYTIVKINSKKTIVIQ